MTHISQLKCHYHIIYFLSGYAFTRGSTFPRAVVCSMASHSPLARQVMTNQGIALDREIKREYARRLNPRIMDGHVQIWDEKTPHATPYQPEDPPNQWDGRSQSGSLDDLPDEFFTAVGSEDVEIADEWKALIEGLRV